MTDEEKNRLAELRKTPTGELSKHEFWERATLEDAEILELLTRPEWRTDEKAGDGLVISRLLLSMLVNR